MIDELLQMLDEFIEAYPDMGCCFLPLKVKAKRLKAQEDRLRFQMASLSEDYENLLRRAESMQELLRKQEACA